MRMVLVALAFALALAGCGKNNGAKPPGGGGGSDEDAARRGEPTAAQRATGNDLKKLAVAYHDYFDKYNKPPTSLTALSEFATGDLIGKVQGGTYVLYLNVPINSLPAGLVNTVLGFERKVPTDGGVVLMADGSTPYMTRDEFARVEKGGK